MYQTNTAYSQRKKLEGPRRVLHENTIYVYDINVTKINLNYIMYRKITLSVFLTFIDGDVVCRQLYKS